MSRAPGATRVSRLPEPRRVLSWLYLGRLLLAGALFPAVAHFTLAASLILIVALAFTAGSFGYTHLSRREPGQNFLYGQLVFDTALVTAVVHLTGGSESAFAPLYILVICAAGLLLPILGGFLIGMLASLLYFADVLWVEPGLPDGGVLLQVGLFTAVAFATGYLGDRLRQTGNELGVMETELRLLRLDTDDILGSISTAVLTVDGGGRLAYINPSAADLLDLPAHRWLGEPILEELDRAAPGLGSVIARSVETRQPIRRFATEGNPDGSFVLGVSTTLVERSGEETPTVTAIFQDITEKMRMEGLRRRAERLEAVAELSASLAHEIKNPLASIRSAVEQLSGDGVEAQDRWVLERLVTRESDRLSRLLAEFLDFARVEVTASNRVDVPTLVRDVVSLVRAHPDSRGRRVEERLPDSGDAIAVQGDADLLHRALFNLVLNGVQWAGDGGRVEVALDALHSDILFPSSGMQPVVRLRISDTGPGVPAEDAEHIFNPFFTLRPGGNGLGLALVQRTVEAHRGAIFVDPVRAAAEDGATFALYLPALEESGDLSPKPFYPQSAEMQAS